MRVVREVYFDHTQYRVRWRVDHENKILNTFRTRREAYEAIKNSGELAEKLTPRLDFVNCRGE